MLVVDRVVAGLPPVADGPHGHAQLVQQDLVRRRTRTQPSLDDRPRPGLVAGHEPVLEPLRGSQPRGRPRHRARWATAHRLPVACSGEVLRVDPPLRADLHGVQPGRSRT